MLQRRRQLLLIGYLRRGVVVIAVASAARLRVSRSIVGVGGGVNRCWVTNDRYVTIYAQIPVLGKESLEEVGEGDVEECPNGDTAVGVVTKIEAG